MQHYSYSTRSLVPVHKSAPPPPPGCSLSLRSVSVIRVGWLVNPRVHGGACHVCLPCAEKTAVQPSTAQRKWRQKERIYAVYSCYNLLRHMCIFCPLFFLKWQSVAPGLSREGVEFVAVMAAHWADSSRGRTASVCVCVCPLLRYYVIVVFILLKLSCCCVKLSTRSNHSFQR
jgi:hypothetical protein